MEEGHQMIDDFLAFGSGSWCQLFEMCLANDFYVGDRGIVHSLHLQRILRRWQHSSP